MKVFAVIAFVLLVAVSGQDTSKSRDSSKPDLPTDPFRVISEKAGAEISDAANGVLQIVTTAANNRVQNYAASLSKKNTSIGNCDDELKAKINNFYDWGSGVIAKCSDVSVTAVKPVISNIWAVVDLIGNSLGEVLGQVKTCIDKVQETQDTSCLADVSSGSLGTATQAGMVIIDFQIKSVLAAIQANADIVKCLADRESEILEAYNNLNHKIDECKIPV